MNVASNGSSPSLSSWKGNVSATFQTDTRAAQNTEVGETSCSPLLLCSRSLIYPQQLRMSVPKGGIQAHIPTGLTIAATVIRLVDRSPNPHVWVSSLPNAKIPAASWI